MNHFLSFGRPLTITPAATYSYWNPSDRAADAILSDNNKVVSSSAAATSWVRSVAAHNSGKWRVQFVNLNQADTSGCGFATSASIGTFLGNTAAGWGLWGNYGSELRRYNNNAFGAMTANWATNDYVDLLLDIDAGKAWWARNGTPVQGNPVAGTGEMYSFTPNTPIRIAADPFALNASWRLRTNPAEMAGSSFSGFTDGWPDPTNDPYFANRIALLHLDGTNGSTTFTDVKGATWTGSGNAQISTAQSLYGGASLSLDGTGDWVSTPDAAAWAFGTGDFFIEAAIYVPDVTGVKTIISQWGSSTSDRAFTFYLNGSTLTLALWPGPVFASANGVTANAWNTVAAGRIGNIIYVWLNGVRSSTTGDYSTTSLPNVTSQVRIGADTNGNSPFSGYIDEVRVSNIAGPNGDYTPTGPFPDS